MLSCVILNPHERVFIDTLKSTSSDEFEWNINGESAQSVAFADPFSDFPSWSLSLSHVLIRELRLGLSVLLELLTQSWG